MPRPQQKAADYHEAGAQPDPDAKGTQAEMEAKDSTCGQSDEPVRDQIGPHGRARIAAAAQRSGANRLHSVEELKRGRDQQESCTDADYNGIRAEDACNRSRE